MKYIILTVSAATMLAACTEKTQVAVKVFRDKVENNMVAAAGEAEVAQELYRKQYAALRERLIKVKAMHAMYIENLDRSYAANDFRRIGMYEKHVRYLSDQIPKAERSLREFHDIYQNQKIELQMLKEEIATHRAMGSIPESSDVLSTYANRAETINKLTTNLRMKAKMAEAATSVSIDVEETLPR